MSYRNDADALQEQLAQVEARLAGTRRERAQLEAAVRDEPALVAELDRLRRALHARAPRSLPLLEDVRVASPCRERWDAMTGDEQVRFCGGCRKNVYNLSAMTREAAQALLVEREGKACVRFYRREDGTVLTADCAVGVRRKRVRIAAAVGAVTALAAGAVAYMNAPAATMGAVGSGVPAGVSPSAAPVAPTPTVVPPTVVPPTPVDDGMLMGEMSFEGPPDPPPPRAHRRPAAR